MAAVPNLMIVKTHFSEKGWLYLQVENGGVILHLERRRTTPGPSDSGVAP